MEHINATVSEISSNGNFLISGNFHAFVLFYYSNSLIKR